MSGTLKFVCLSPPLIKTTPPPKSTNKKRKKKKSSTGLGEWCWGFTAFQTFLKECWCLFKTGMHVESYLICCHLKSLCLCPICIALVYCPGRFFTFSFCMSLYWTVRIKLICSNCCFQKKWPSLQASLLARNQIYRKSTWDSHVTPFLLQCLRFLALALPCKVSLCLSFMHSAPTARQ